VLLDRQNCFLLVVDVQERLAPAVLERERVVANAVRLDPNFQGYARIVTDKDGRYRFLTIIPGPYPAIGDWVRPRHIHFKVHAPFNPPVNTQMYFAGEPLNDKDLLLAPLSPEQRASREVSFDTVRADGIRTGVFNPILAEGWTPPEGLVMPGAG
jgi:protocatechuate 3,4-dioxygenase beta subunit